MQLSRSLLGLSKRGQQKHVHVSIQTFLCWLQEDDKTNRPALDVTGLSADASLRSVACVTTCSAYGMGKRERSAAIALTQPSSQETCISQPRRIHFWGHPKGKTLYFGQYLDSLGLLTGGGLLGGGWYICCMGLTGAIAAAPAPGQCGSGVLVPLGGHQFLRCAHGRH